VQLGQLAGTFIYPTGAEEAATAVEKLVTGGTVEKKQVLGTTAVTLDNAASLYLKFDFSTKS
jgi:ribose transport system substrate-binding protein